MIYWKDSQELKVQGAFDYTELDILQQGSQIRIGFLEGRAITCALGIYVTCALDITCALGINHLCTYLLPSSGVGPTPHATNEWVGVGGRGGGGVPYSVTLKC